MEGLSAGSLRASDAERERVVAVLREHWLAGRLDADEFEQRVSEAQAARHQDALAWTLRELPLPVVPRFLPPPAAPPGDGRATAALVLSLTGLSLLALTFGLLAILALPLSATGWALGSGARRRLGRGGETAGRGKAVAGEVVGIVGTVCSVLVLTGCAVLVLA